MDIYLLSLVSGSKSGAGSYDDSIKTPDFSFSPPAPQVHSGGTAKGKFDFKYVYSIHMYTLYFWSKSGGEYLIAYHIVETLERFLIWQFGNFFEGHWN